MLPLLGRNDAVALGRVTIAAQVGTGKVAFTPDLRVHQTVPLFMRFRRFSLSLGASPARTERAGVRGNFRAADFSRSLESVVPGQAC
jgi:hypothetical protein